ncbi:hypothetical protein [Pseudoalteromonas sp. R3]|uniref:hypothetical protein n=1 Tax=Pseudoalteromonas sp. R3 TaxID=1709477 RepID=UPI000FDDA70D|nr:hypothetical protein [Pseudoalteromonas sp. R3]AZZ96609.1 hypothetical protein ELR70_05195 [Pseudoalteromonas sp. R3]
MVTKTVPTVSLGRSSVSGDKETEITLSATAVDAGKDLKALKICKANSRGDCTGAPIYSCSSESNGRCQGEKLTATVTYDMPYNQSQRFVAFATDKFGLTGRAEFTQQQITEPNTKSTVELSLYDADGLPLADGHTLFGEQDVMVVARIKDADTTQPNWPNSASYTATGLTWPLLGGGSR